MASAAATPCVLRDDDGAVRTLTLNRGERFNPLSLDMVQALRDELRAAAAEPGVRVVVIAAAGRGFCAGHDLREMREHSGDLRWQRELFETCSALMMDLVGLPQPVIARVHGIATAAGCQLVSACDLAVASEQAQFALPGVNVGVFCTTPAVGVARNMSRKHVMDMLLTGEPIDAHEAAVRGLVNRVVRADLLDAEIARYVRTICARSAAVIAAGKRAFYRQVDLGLRQAYQSASEDMVCGLGLADAAEGLDAFLQKRPAVWQDK